MTRICEYFGRTYPEKPGPAVPLLRILRDRDWPKSGDESSDERKCENHEHQKLPCHVAGENMSNSEQLIQKQNLNRRRYNHSNRVKALYWEDLRRRTPFFI
jgi:hypothetical protein